MYGASVCSTEFVQPGVALHFGLSLSLCLSLSLSLTLPLKRTVFEIVDFKNAVILKTGLGVREGH